NPGDDLIISGNVYGAFQSGIIKTGPGTLALTGNNSYTSNTTINEGVLSISSSANLSGSNLSTNIILNGGTLLLTGSTSFTRVFQIGASGGTFDTGGFNLTLYYISGAGPIAKNGAGNLTIGEGPGDNQAVTNSGLMTVNGGTLTLNKSTTTVSLGGDLVVNGGTVTANRAGQFSPNSNVTISGGAVNFSNSNFASLTALSGSFTGTANLKSTATYALTLGTGSWDSVNLTGASGGGINLPVGGNLSAKLNNLGLGGVN